MERDVLLLMPMPMPMLLLLVIALVFAEAGVGVELLSFSPPPPLSMRGGICEGVNCLRGSCVEVDELIPFKCQCDKGWRNLLNISFLGCGIPDCNINLACEKASPAPAPAPAPAPVPVDNSSLLDLCTWQLCGNGECVITNKAIILPSYVCQCNKGYYNLFNSSSAICVPNCTFETNCRDLGISLTPGSTAPSSSSNSSTSTPNAAGRVSTNLQGKIMKLMSLSLLLWLW